jgi:hypothetical protein
MTKFLLQLLLALFTISTLHIAVCGQTAGLKIQVVDTENHPISGARFAIKGVDIVGVTDQTGGLVFKLPSAFTPRNEIELDLVSASQDLVFISPWNNRITIPPVKNGSLQTVKIVLGRRGDRNLLFDGGVRAVVGQWARRIGDQPTMVISLDERKRQLDLIAHSYGLDPQQVEDQIAVWATMLKTPY